MSKIKQDGGKQSDVKKTKAKSNAGRKTKYHTHIEPYLEHIGQMRRNGLTLDQIAERFKIALSTLCEYQLRYSELKECLNENAELAVAAVENALFKNAVSGNLGAQIFYLKNRASNKWRDKQHVFQQSSVSVRKDYENMTDEELAKEDELLDTILPAEFGDEEREGELH